MLPWTEPSLTFRRTSNHIAFHFSRTCLPLRDCLPIKESFDLKRPSPLFLRPGTSHFELEPRGLSTAQLDHNLDLLYHALYGGGGACWLLGCGVGVYSSRLPPCLPPLLTKKRDFPAFSHSAFPHLYEDSPLVPGKSPLSFSPDLQQPSWPIARAIPYRLSIEGPSLQSSQGPYRAMHSVFTTRSRIAPPSSTYPPPISSTYTIGLSNYPTFF